MSKASRLPRTADSTLLRTIAHRPFRRMLARQGIDPTRGWKGCEEMIFRAMRKCSDCSAPAACRLWLAENHSRGAYPSFCANGAAFEACRIVLDPHVPPLNLAEPETFVSGEPALATVLGDPMIQQLAASDGVQPFTRAPQPKGGNLAELDELIGQFL